MTQPEGVPEHEAQSWETLSHGQKARLYAYHLLSLEGRTPAEDTSDPMIRRLAGVFIHLLPFLKVLLDERVRDVRPPKFKHA